MNWSNTQRNRTIHNENALVLVADDNATTRLILRDTLEQGGYMVIEAKNGQEALAIFSEIQPDIIMLDCIMPVMDGFEACLHLRKTYSHDMLPILMITSLGDNKSIERVFQVGATDYIHKPVNWVALRHRVQRLLDAKAVQSGFKKNEQMLKRINEELEIRVAARTVELTKVNERLQRELIERHRAEKALAESLDHLRKTLEETVNALAVTAEKRDPYTAGHQKRVAQLACAIAREMHLPQEQIEGINVAGILHDIGKIYVPAEILAMPRRLEEMEMALIRAHPEIGHQILKTIPFTWPISKIILQHHERIDGSGYPLNLMGDAILLEARIIGVADVVEAIASHRPYRPSLGVGYAIEHITNNKGILYDSQVVEACLNIFSNVASAENFIFE
jgi:putative nucleotidyltransferase with HDIG domain